LARQHLSFEHRYAVDRPFNRAGAVWQRESIGHGVEIAAKNVRHNGELKRAPQDRLASTTANR
jgi:hypothetical protein